jgi:glutaredoxin
MAGSEESRNLKADLEQALLRERVRDETIRALEQEREDLQKQLRESKQVPGFWIDDKIKLTGEL